MVNSYRVDYGKLQARKVAEGMWAEAQTEGMDRRFLARMVEAFTELLEEARRRDNRAERREYLRG